jgi:3-hydroxyacyl-CoA dehydrogenase
MAKVSTSAEEARGFGFLAEGDQVTMNRERVVGDAKARALEMVRTGYQPPQPRTDIPAPGDRALALLKLGVHFMHEGAYISDHDQKVAVKIAEILCGGNVTPGSPISEQYVLDLEREAFKSLCGEPKTQQRIAHTLKTGKPLRN